MFTKFASLESVDIIDVKGAPSQVRTASLSKVGEFSDFKTSDGYMYARIRAISSRVNKNNDGWPSIELAGGPERWDSHLSRHTSSSGFSVSASKDDEFGFSTFVGKPIFVDHNNSDPSRARGVIVDASLHVQDHKTASDLDPYYAASDADPRHLPPTHVELLLEIDAKSFPKFAQAILEGSKDSSKGIDGFSMGCNVDRTVCSHCSNVAHSPEEYCDHIRAKGAMHDFVLPDGTKTSKRSYENCEGIGFFEISGVFDPADPTALIQGLIDESNKKKGSFLQSKVANNTPQSELVRAPESVDTLRDEKICEVCGSEMENAKCDVCGFEEPPEQMQTPDLSVAKDLDVNKRNTEDTQLPANEITPPGSEPQAKSFLQSKKPIITANIKDSMRWAPKITAAVDGDEPVEVVKDDQTKPVTSAFRTAKQLIEAAKDKLETNKTAAEPSDSSGKADKRVNVTDIGGVEDASNESASKADAQVAADGKGGVGLSDTSADSTDSLGAASPESDDSGFDKTKTTDDSGPTKTFPNEKQQSPVTNETYPSSDEGVKKSHDSEAYPKDDNGIAGGSAVKGTQPVDPSGKADDRVDVLSPVTSPENNSGPTDTWSGTDGNGVTKQQPAVTRKPSETTVSSTHVLAAFQQAEKEVSLGVTSPESKYARAQELSELTEDQLKLASELTNKFASRTASSKREVTRVPSLQRSASVSTKVDDTTLNGDDSALFI